MKKFKGILIVFLVVVLLFSTLAIVFVGLTSNAQLNNSRLASKTNEAQVYDLNNNLLEDSSSKYIEYDELPKNLINAFVAVEDKRFFKHKGLDYVRIVGAARSNLKSRSFSEGASTITCQLIKNTHLSSDKTISRKLNEAKLAKQVERLYDKETIITMYLNAIYFGNSIYGIGRAARVYFDKDVSDITLAECATLAAVVVNPAKYSPIINYNANRERRNTVLKLMHEQGYIKESEYLTTRDLDTVIVGNTHTVNNQSYKHNAVYEASTILNIDTFTLKERDIKVYTYCNPYEQSIMFGALNNKNLLIANKNGILPDAAALFADNNSGGISAYYSSMYHLAENFRRQPGSLIKPITVYGAAIEKGVVLPATPLLDEHTDFDGYKPRNYNDNYYGWTNVRNSLSNSLNVSAVKVLSYTTIPYAMEYSKKMGLTLDKQDANLALALGGLTYGSTMTELSGAYMALANSGVYTKPVFVRKIVDAQGKVLYTHKKEKTQATSQDTAYMVTDMLQDTVKTGTAKKLCTLSYDIAAKTGTVAAKGGNSDAWCAAYTTKNTLVVWQGNSTYNPHSVLANNITGGSYPTLMARQIFSNLKDLPKGFTRPSTINLTAFDRIAIDNNHLLQLASEYTPSDYVVYDYAPKDNNIRVSEIFTRPSVENFSVEYKEGKVWITFDALPFYEYDITRKNHLEESNIATITSENGKTIIVDTPDKEGVFLYGVQPYINNNNQKIMGLATLFKGIYYKRELKEQILENTA